ncbi:MAG: biotin transporter BioY [Clostridiales bacterium]|nr:biotin transporter BioY [Clostridiales bacterium]
MSTNSKNQSISRKSSKTLELALCGLFAALMAICSWIQIPTTVPFTLQTFGVFVAIGLLGGKLGTISIAVYIALGAIGVPVFSGFGGGMGVILGSTGGYIIGFIGSALVMWLILHFFGKSTFVLAISMVMGLLVCYAFGTAWFMVIYTRDVGAVGLATVLGWCVTPFIIPDLIKIACALLITNRVKKFMPVLGRK